MARGVRWYLVGSFVLVSLAGCGRFFFEEREPWRTEAEVACLKSGAVKESADLVRMSPISGPGVCGAEFPLKVTALGESTGTFGFADEDLRPPAPIGNQPRWPIREAAPPPAPAPYSAPAPYPSRPPYYPDAPPRAPGYGAPPPGPISLRPPGLAAEDDINLPPTPAWRSQPAQRPYPPINPRDAYAPSYPERAAAPALPPADRYHSLRLGPPPQNPVTGYAPVAVKPAATLACPIVSALDHWLSDSVQPASMRWFGMRVVEIKQISAYSCRGMNGHSWEHISEHAFGNALDIAAFTLADGRQITVKDGWRGPPREQGFWRDVEASACQQFSTVLAPGSNAYHYDHIHVDLMRRASRRLICEPAPVSGEEVAARAAQRNPYASRESLVTGSLARQQARPRQRDKVSEEDEFEDD
jgi:Extensin-like protein C-terminus